MQRLRTFPFSREIAFVDAHRRLQLWTNFVVLDTLSINGKYMVNPIYTIAIFGICERNLRNM
jgi:hypothetical protein